MLVEKRHNKNNNNCRIKLTCCLPLVLLQVTTPNTKSFLDRSLSVWRLSAWLPEGWRPVCRRGRPPPPRVWSQSWSRTGCRCIRRVPGSVHFLYRLPSCCGWWRRTSDSRVPPFWASWRYLGERSNEHTHCCSWLRFTTCWIKIIIIIKPQKV